MDAVAMSWSTPVLLGLLILFCLAYLYYRYVHRPLQYFKVHGIPGPRPKPIIGNLDIIRKFSGDAIALNKYLFEKYGPICGIFLGMKPFVVISDVNLAKEISVKHFDKFMNRFEQSGIFTVCVDGRRHDVLFSSRDDVWRKRRHILSPAFSARKMKLMEPLIKESTSRLAEKISAAAEKGETVEALQLHNKLAMEIILSTAFGRAVDVQGGKGGKLYEAALEVIAGFSSGQDNQMPLTKLFQFLTFSFPPLEPLLRWILSNYTAFGKSLDCLSQSALKLVQVREASNHESARKDLLQLMIDASDSDTRKGLEKGEIIVDCVGFLLAGYETTSSALTFATYLLAANPDEQERLANEIHEYFEEHPDKSMYDASHELQYLEMVIEESLRMYPPVPGIIRHCNEECVASGVHFGKGVSALIAVTTIHYDPELWVDPQSFNPERFTLEEKAKRHPCAYMPFGHGPRSCIGMRLALVEVKMALIEIVSKFRIVLAPEMKLPLEVVESNTLKPKNGLFVKYELRKGN